MMPLPSGDGVTYTQRPPKRVKEALAELSDISFKYTISSGIRDFAPLRAETKTPWNVEALGDAGDRNQLIAYGWVHEVTEHNFEIFTKENVVLRLWYSKRTFRRVVLAVVTCRYLCGPVDGYTRVMNAIINVKEESEKLTSSILWPIKPPEIKIVQDE